MVYNDVLFQILMIGRHFFEPSPGETGSCAWEQARFEGESPLPGDARFRVAKGNCAAARRVESNPRHMQSVG